MIFISNGIINNNRKNLLNHTCIVQFISLRVSNKTFLCRLG